MLYTDRLSEHWTVAELCRREDWPILANSLECQNHLKRLVVAALEPIRTLWGAPLVAVSGYRSPQHNARVGGASQSQHMFGRAADIAPADIDWRALREGRGKSEDASRLESLIALIEHHLGKELEVIGGIGKYPGWAHCDIRPRGENGHIYRWQGKGIGSEQ